MIMKNRFKYLEQAKSLTLAGEYQSAIEIVDDIIKDNPKDIEALRFKGNTLELQVLAERAQMDLDASADDARLATARTFYKAILEIEPDNITALKDLADNLKLSGDILSSAQVYDQLIEELGNRISCGANLKYELSEALQERSEI